MWGGRGCLPAFTRLRHECQDLFESVRWNACVHRPDLGLYSRPKDFWGNGVRAHVNSKGKIPSTGKRNLLGGGSNSRRCIKQDSEHKTLPTNYSGPNPVICASVFVLPISRLRSPNIMLTSSSTLHPTHTHAVLIFIPHPLPIPHLFLYPIISHAAPLPHPRTLLSSYILSFPAA